MNVRLLDDHYLKQPECRQVLFPPDGVKDEDENQSLAEEQLESSLVFMKAPSILTLVYHLWSVYHVESYRHYDSNYALSNVN